MLDKAELAACMARQGFTKKRLAKEIGVSTRTLSSRIKNGYFGSDEIERMISVLHIDKPMPIFFAKEVTCEDTKEKEEQN